MVAVSAYMGDTRCSGVLYSACDVLEMSVVRGVGGVCDMCLCMPRGVWVVCVEGEWVRGLSLGFTNPGGTRGRWDMCLCICFCGVCGVGWVCWVSVWYGRVVWC